MKLTQILEARLHHINYVKFIHDAIDSGITHQSHPNQVITMDQSQHDQAIRDLTQEFGEPRKNSSLRADPDHHGPRTIKAGYIHEPMWQWSFEYRGHDWYVTLQYRDMNHDPSDPNKKHLAGQESGLKLWISKHGGGESWTLT